MYVCIRQQSVDPTNSSAVVPLTGVNICPPEHNLICGVYLVQTTTSLS
jgi:hypothetical protein